jgi:hypothetical protein
MGFNLLNLVRKKREGIQHERTLRAIYVLLSGWCRFKGERNQPLEEPHDKLRAIPFDKLIMVFARLWDELYYRTGARFKTRSPDSITREENEESVTFPVPYNSFPGKHGSGRAVSSFDARPEFLVSVLYRLREEDILPYFDISPPADTPRKPNDYRTTIEPAVSAAASDGTLLEDFTEKERTVLCDLNNAMKRLGADEIRALGTHENFEETLKDVKREFDWMRRSVIEAEENIKAGKPFHDAAREALEYADEACRKSERNRDDYQRARNILCAELTDPELKAAFLERQKSPDEIWNREMKVVARRARRAYARCHWIERIAFWSSLDSSHASQRNWATALEEVNAELKAESIAGLPDSLDRVFTAGSLEFRAGLMEKILKQLAELKNP